VTLTVPQTDGPADGIVPLPGAVSLANDWFGASCAQVGDLNGDGAHDIVVNAPGPGGLRASAFRGRADLDANPPVSPDAVLVYPNPVFPVPIAGGADLDGDGLPDFAVGDLGAVYLFCGDQATLVRPVPCGVFPMSSSFIPHPAQPLPSWIDSGGVVGLPDLAIGDDSGARVLIRY